MDHEPRGCYYFANIEKLTLENEEKGPVIVYRDPSGHLELGVMSVKPNDVVPYEVHKTSTQFIRVEQGYGTAYIAKTFVQKLEPGSSVVVPAGVGHEIRAGPRGALKFYTIYSKSVTDEWEH